MALNWEKWWSTHWLVQKLDVVPIRMRSLLLEPLLGLRSLERSAEKAPFVLMKPMLLRLFPVNLDHIYKILGLVPK